MGKGRERGRSDPREGRGGRTFPDCDYAARSGDETGRKYGLCVAMDRDRAWRFSEQLQPVGKSAELERVPRNYEERLGAGAERRVCGRGRKHRVCDGGASADSEEGTRRSAGAWRHRRIRMERL